MSAPFTQATCVVAVLVFAAIGPAQVDAPAPQPTLMEISRLQLAFWRNLTNNLGQPCDANGRQSLGDVNGDGLADIVVANHGYWRQMRLLLSQGHGRFRDVTLTHMPARMTRSQSFRIGDIDGDGDRDIVGSTEDASAPQLVRGIAYINDGTGHFTDQTAARIPNGAALQGGIFSPYNLAVAMADFDRDGDLDVVMAGPSARNDRSFYLMRNDGRGYFTIDPNALPPDGGQYKAYHGGMYEFDADGDGDIDLVCNTWNNTLGYWLNDGTARFTAVTQTHVHPVPNYTALEVQPGDVDGDGDMDLATTAGYSRSPVKLYLNDGNGHLTEVTGTHMPNDTVGSAVVRFGDFDDDGDLDLINSVGAGSIPPGEEQILLNDGTGHFTFDRSGAILAPHSNGNCLEILVGDLDGDGDTDLMIPDLGCCAMPSCRTRYYSNTTRQVAADAPPTLGSPWRVTVWATDGAAAILAYGLRELRTPTPYGDLHLDPAMLLIWPNVLNFGSIHRQPVDIPIPPLPMLAGLPLYAQALVVDRSGRARFTNLWVENAIR